MSPSASAGTAAAAATRHPADAAVARWQAMLALVTAGHFTSVAALVRACGGARATGYRLATQMLAAGFIDWDANGALILGDAALRTGLRAQGHGELDLRLLPCLQALRRELDETVFSGFWRGGDRRIDLGPVMCSAAQQEILYCDGRLVAVALRPLAAPWPDGAVLARVRTRERTGPSGPDAQPGAPSAPLLTRVVEVVLAPLDDAGPLLPDAVADPQRPSRAVLGVWPKDWTAPLEPVALALTRQVERLRRAAGLSAKARV